MVSVIASEKLERAKVWAEDDSHVRWSGAFASRGVKGGTQSSTMVQEIEPGGRLGWHTDATEKTQYALSGPGTFRSG